MNDIQSAVLTALFNLCDAFFPHNIKDGVPCWDASKAPTLTRHIKNANELAKEYGDPRNDKSNKETLSGDDNEAVCETAEPSDLGGVAAEHEGGEAGPKE